MSEAVPSPPPPNNLISNLITGPNTEVTDSTIRSSALVNGVLGIIFVLLFLLCQAKSVLYRFRLVSPSVTIRPPPLPTGWASLWGWATTAIMASDQDLLLSCGLDALMFVKMFTFGIQLLAPIALVGLVVLVPIHYTSDGLGGAAQDAKHAVFLRLTTTNIPNNDPVLWLHFVLVLLYIAWGCWLLKWHYHMFVTIRQHWMRTGDNENEWRASYAEREARLEQRGRPRLIDVISSLRAGGGLNQAAEDPAITAESPGGAQGSSRASGGSILPAPPGLAMSSIGSRSSAAAMPGFLDSGDSSLVAAAAGGPSGVRRLMHSSGPGALRHRRRQASSFIAGSVAQRVGSGVPMGPSASGASHLSYLSPLGGAGGRSAEVALAGSSGAERRAQDMHAMYRLLEEELGQAVAAEPTVIHRLQPGSTSASVVGEEAGADVAAAGTEPGPLSSGDGPKSGPSRSAKSAGVRRVLSAVKVFGKRAARSAPGADATTTAPIVVDDGAAAVPPSAAPAAAPVNVDAGLEALAPQEAPFRLSSRLSTGNVELPPPPQQLPAVGEHSAQPSPLQQQLQQQQRAVEEDTVQPPLTQQLSAVAEHAPLPSASLGQQEGVLNSHFVVLHVEEVENDTGAFAGQAGAAAAAAAVGQVQPTPHGSGPTSRLRWADSAHVTSFTAAPGVPMPRAHSLGQDLGSGQHAGPKLVGGDGTPAGQGKRLPPRASEGAHAERQKTSRHARSPSMGAKRQLAVRPSQATDSTGSKGEVVLAEMPMWWSGMAHTVASAALRTRASPSRMGTQQRSGSLLAHQGSGGHDSSPHTSTPLAMQGSAGSGGPHTPGAAAGEGGGGPTLYTPKQARKRVSIGLGRTHSGHHVHKSRPHLLHHHSLPSTPTTTATTATAVTTEGKAADLGPEAAPEPQHMEANAADGTAAAGDGNNQNGAAVGLRQLLALPSVRHLKTVNTVDRWGNRLAVNAQQYAVLVTDVNQDLWNCKPLWPRLRSGEGHGVLSWFLSPAVRRWIMNNYAVTALSIYDDTDDEGDDEEEEEDDGATVFEVHADGSPADSGQVLQQVVVVADGGAANGKVNGQERPVGEGAEGDGIINDTPVDLPKSVSTKPDGDGDGDDDADLEARCARARELWAAAAAAVRAGRVRRLLLSARRYSVVTATFARLFPQDFDRAIPVLNHKRVDLLLTQLDFHHAALLKAEAKLAATGERPTGRPACCGCRGPKEDLIELHASRVEELQHEIREARAEAHSSGYSPSWLVFFKTQHAAAVCAQSVIQSEDNQEFRVHPAPGPEEVNWPALWLTYRQRANRVWVVRPLLFLLIIFPVGLFSGAAMQLEYALCPLISCQPLGGGDVYSTEAVSCGVNATRVDGTSTSFRWDWYCDKDTFISVYLSKFMTGWLPSFLLMLWQNMVLPLSMLMLAQAGGTCLSFSQLDTLIARYIFWFNLLQAFLGSVLGSALVSQVNAIFTSGPGQALSIFGNYVPSSSNFFISYILLRLLTMLPMRMFIPHIGIRMYLFRRYLFRCSSVPLTSREFAFLYANTSMRLGFEVGMTLLMLLIPVVFAVLAPVLSMLGVAYLLVSWVFWRYAVLYVFVRKYESGGMMWPFVTDRMLIIYGLLGLLTACVLVAKRAFVQAALLFVIVPYGLYKFSRHMHERYVGSLDVVPLTMARNAPPASIDPSAYIPAPLQPGSRGWHPEWAKVWQGWNLPVGYSVT